MKRDGEVAEPTLGPRRSPEYLGKTVIPPIFIAALMLFILKTFLLLWLDTGAVSSALKFCLCAFSLIYPQSVTRE